VHVAIIFYLLTEAGPLFLLDKVENSYFLCFTSVHANCLWITAKHLLSDNSDKLASAQHFSVEMDATRLYSVSQKNPPWGFLTFFPKRLGSFSPNFTCLLHVPIYARLQIFIQLSATLTKLCHTKHDHPVHIICSMFTIGRNARVPMFAKVIDSFVDRCLWQVITDLLQCTF